MVLQLQNSSKSNVTTWAKGQTLNCKVSNTQIPPTQPWLKGEKSYLKIKSCCSNSEFTEQEADIYCTVWRERKETTKSKKYTTKRVTLATRVGIN